MYLINSILQSTNTVVMQLASCLEWSLRSHTRAVHGIYRYFQMILPVQAIVLVLVTACLRQCGSQAQNEDHYIAANTSTSCGAGSFR